MAITVSNSIKVKPFRSPDHTASGFFEQCQRLMVILIAQFEAKSKSNCGYIPGEMTKCLDWTIGGKGDGIGRSVNA